MKVLTTASLFLLLLTARSTFGQFKIHHTTYGAPFGVPSHGSNTFLSPFGANSLSSVLTALGIGPSSPNSQINLTPAASASPNTAAVPTFVISNASNRNRRPATQAFGQATNARNPAVNGQTVLRASPTQSAGGGPQQIPAQPIVSNQITSNPIGAATSNNLASRFAPPPPANANTFNSNQGTQANAGLEPQNINLLNSLFNNLLAPNPSTPFSGLSSQTPFIVILPQGDAGQTGTPQSAQVIMNVDPTRSSQGNSPQSVGSSNIRANDVISNVAQFMQANGLSTDLLGGTGSQGTSNPRIITVTPQVANQGVSSFPQETPVLVLLDPASFQDPSRAGTSAALGSSTTGQNALGNAGSRASNQNFLNALTALAQPSPPTQSPTPIPTATSHSSSAPGTSGSGTTQANGLPPFPGQEPVIAVTNANAPVNGRPSTAGGPSSTLQSGTAPNTSQVGASSPGFASGLPPRKNTKMIIPVIQDIRSLSRGAGGVYMYSFSIAGSDGITRHEVGEVAPGIRKISRTVSPASQAGIGSASGVPGVHGHSAMNGGVNGATSADIPRNSGAAGANGLVDASMAAAMADVFNVLGNYSYVDPNGQVLRLHYTHGEPNFVHQPPPQPLPPTAPHPFDFLLNKLTDLRVHHHLDPLHGAARTGATGTGATGAGAAGAGATGAGATGARATGAGAAGVGATGNGAAGTGAIDFGAAGNGATGNEATGSGATGSGATVTGATGNGATGTGAADQSTAAHGNSELAAGGEILETGTAIGSGPATANEVAANEVGSGTAGSSVTGGANEVPTAVDGSAAAAAEGAAAGADPTAAEIAPSAA